MKRDLAFALLEELPTGVIVIARDTRVVLFNRAEARLAQRRDTDVLGKPFFSDVAPCFETQQLGSIFAAKIGKEEIDETREMTFPFPFHEKPRDVVVRLRSQWLDGEPHGVIYLEDVSAQRAVEATRHALSELLVHDLKNPLAIVMANLDYLENSFPESVARDAAHEGMLAARRLNQMIGGLLELNRLQTGALPLVRTAQDTTELLAAVAREAQLFARAADVELRYAAPDPGEPLHASIDRDVVRRALDNLVDNAIRLSPPGGRVELTGTRSGAFVELAVADDGPGIAPELRERVFDPHARLDPTQTTRGDNQGLGLTFVRLAAVAHGGRVEIRPRGDRGAVFAMSLPVVAG